MLTPILLESHLLDSGHTATIWRTPEGGRKTIVVAATYPLDQAIARIPDILATPTQED